MKTKHHKCATKGCEVEEEVAVHITRSCLPVNFPYNSKRGNIYTIKYCRDCARIRKRKYTEDKKTRDIYGAGYEMAKLVNQIFGGHHA